MYHLFNKYVNIQFLIFRVVIVVMWGFISGCHKEESSGDRAFIMADFDYPLEIRFVDSIQGDFFYYSNLSEKNGRRYLPDSVFIVNEKDDTSRLKIINPSENSIKFNGLMFFDFPEDSATVFNNTIKNKEIILYPKNAQEHAVIHIPVQTQFRLSGNLKHLNSSVDFEHIIVTYNNANDTAIGTDYIGLPTRVTFRIDDIN